ncbi:non-canonical purine NTP pyrophosphatase [Tissierella sp. MB52-C2]|uniref:non-canonical purine NTP pyrophosphatase n=1 Tax=Tissierella sp. MB52-C2 TaxID=3070999 RepID=UPI00280B6192|nr:non-canonical purine NTP pyrophosphatase [Tissierella sp. MB52-C2]WMM23829.1 non-canonical purine NTP pyrophosphatase [Tissierella sp. MB52-C2]
MKILYGTTNLAKLESMRKTLKDLDIEVIGLNSIAIKNDYIDETGNNPLENARIKALEYYKKVKMPVFSCDSGLYIKGLKSEQQPGVYVRRVNGKELTDEEMIEYYGGIARENGGQVFARYENAICFVLDEKRIYEYQGDEISSEEFIIIDKPHPRRNQGFPLDSLSVEKNSKKYYLDMNREEKGDKIGDGFRTFFKRYLLGYNNSSMEENNG